MFCGARPVLGEREGREREGGDREGGGRGGGEREGGVYLSASLEPKTS